MDFYRTKGIKSMRGPYIIGIYGRTRSTYTISITSEQHPLAMLEEGLPVKMS